MPLTRDGLVIFVREKAGGNVAIDDETLLFSTGLIDSFALVDLMLFIEGAADIRVEPFDVSLDHFDSVARIMQYVQKRTAATAKLDEPAVEPAVEA